MTSYLQAKFISKLPELDLTDAPFSVPDSAGREELNELINNLLAETNTEWTAKRFDFLIDQNLLIGSLQEFVQENGLSTESVLEIECILRDVPQPHSDLPHDDWVSAVRTTAEFIIAGCYDSTVHIWNHQNGEKLAKVPAHLDAIKCLALVPFTTTNIVRFATGSQDQTVSVWEYDPSNNDDDHPAAAVCTLLGKGHERSVECVCCNGDGTRLATGGFDGYLKIWNAMADGDDDEASKSRRESKRMKANENSRTVTTVPMVTLSGHREAVTGCCWTDTAEVTTASLDRSIVIWDLELAGQKNMLAGAKAFTSIAHSPLSRTLITGSADRHVRLWDPRSKEGTMVKMTFTSHNGWVVDVDWSKTNEHAFISASYDAVMKMWDTRSPKAPLYDLSGHDGRLLCCDWSQPKLVVSGGVDKSVKVFRTHHNQCENACEV